MLRRALLFLLPVLLLTLCFGAASAEAVPPEFVIREPAPVFPVPREARPDENGLSAAELSDYTVNAAGLITGYRGTDTTLVIPAEINGQKITGLAYGAFRNNTVLTEVVLSEGIDTVGYLAFSGCTNLRRVTLPESISLIDGWAFQGCTNLTEINIPANVTVIGECAFYQCTALADIFLPEGLESIGDWTFSACASLTAVAVPDSVTTIGTHAFFNCDNLESLRLSDSIASIGELFAANCTRLANVNIPASVRNIGEYAFFGCAKLSALALPDGLEAIDAYAFYGCTTLDNIVIPAAAKSIGEMAFAGCDNVRRIELPDTIETLQEGSLPPNAVIVFGTSSLIEEYALSHGMKFICDGKNTADDDCDTVAEKIDWVLDNYITDGMSEYEKALRLYNWICANVAYDYQWLETKIPTTEYGVTGEGALLGGWAVCEGYAKAYMWLLDEAGLDCRFVTGMSGNESHAWNLVCIDGKWYQFDPTWDEAGNGSAHAYFGLTDYAMRSNHTQNDNKNIVCNSYDANYEYRNGEYDALLDALVSEINASVARGELSGTIDVSEVEQSDSFWYDPSPYTVAFILNQKTDWPISGRAEITPSDPCFTFTFEPDSIIVTDMQVSGLGEPASTGRYLMVPGETAQLTVTTTPADVPVTFASSRPDVLSVTAEGLITAANTGSATLTITANNYSIELDFTVSSMYIVLPQKLFEGYPGDRINPDAFVAGDPDSEYRNRHDYLFANVTYGNSTEYIGYYTPEWNAAMSSWNFSFAVDCLKPGVTTYTIALMDDISIADTLTFIVHSESALEIPASVKELQAEAFADVSAEEIILPEGVESIGEKTFSGCEALALIHMPTSLTEIADNAFEGCSEVTLLCKADSHAEAYAIENDLDYIILP